MWCFWCDRDLKERHAADCLYKRLERDETTLSIEDFPFVSAYY
jgi:hypothetical protein